MTLLPLARRELQVASRDTRNYLVRMIAPGTMFLLFLWLTWMFKGAIGTMLPGNFIFRFVSYAAFGFILFEGAMRTGDSISREKREDTLGLLFLTNLRGWDIVLGKLIGSGTRSMLGLLATLPVLVISRLTGGVLWWEIVRTSVNLLNTLFLSLSVGLAVSVFCKRQTVANSISAFAIMFFAGAVPALGELIREDLEMPGLSLFTQWFSPVYSANMCFSSARGLTTNYFWTSILAQFLTSIVLLCLASSAVERTWRIQPPSSKALLWKQKWEGWCLGKPEIRWSRRLQLLEKNPFHWLTSRDRLGQWWQFFYMALALLVVAGISVIYNLNVAETIGVMVAVGFVLNLLFRIKIASQSSQQLIEDRQSGALELILATPLPVRDIIKGINRTLRNNFVKPLIALCVLQALIFLAFLISQGETDPMQQVVLGAYMVTFVGDMVLLPWIAMWKTMRLQNPNHGPATALIIMMLIPWLLFGIAVELLRRFAPGWWQQASGEATVLLAVAIWAVVGVSAAWHARVNLLRHFRAAAADRTRFAGNRWLRFLTKT